MNIGALLAYPFLEILLFVVVARAIGWDKAFALTFATSFLGFTLLRCQRRWQIFGQNDFTTKSIENFLFANLGAFALLLPGFISDVFGLLVIFPWTRKLLIAFFHLIHFDVSQHTSPLSVFKTYNFSNGQRRDYDVDPENSEYDPRYDSDYDEIIDVESVDEAEAARDRREDGPNDKDDAIDVEFTVRD